MQSEWLRLMFDQPCERSERRRNWRASSTSTRAVCSVDRELPKPKKMGGAPPARNFSTGSGSGLLSGKNQAPVWKLCLFADMGVGAKIESAATQGQSVKTWLWTFSIAA